MTFLPRGTVSAVVLQEVGAFCRSSVTVTPSITVSSPLVVEAVLALRMEPGTPAPLSRPEVEAVGQFSVTAVSFVLRRCRCLLCSLTLA